MGVDRLLRDEDGVALLELTREIATQELAPRAAEAEQGRFPAEAYQLLGRSGLMGLPFGEAYGGGEQPYETYLQVVEEIAIPPRASVSVSASTRSRSRSSPSTAPPSNATPGCPAWSAASRGAYCLSEPGWLQGRQGRRGIGPSSR